MEPSITDDVRPIAGPPAASPFARLRARDLLGLTVVCLVGLVILMLIASAIAHRRPPDILLFTVFFCALGIPLPILARRAGLSWHRLYGGVPTRRELLLSLVVVPIVCATFTDVILLYVPLSYVAPEFVRTHLLDNTVLAVHTVGQWLLLMVLGVVMAPIFEETLFRGILLHRWAHRWGTMTGVFASSALFALGHGEWPGKFLFGVAMSLLYLRTGKLRLNIFAHALNNFCLIAPSLADVLHPKPGETETLAALRGELPMALPWLAATVVSFWLYRRYIWGDASIRGLLRGTVPYDRTATATHSVDSL